jgi:N-acetylmuramoyl-L-alanine amidase
MMAHPVASASRPAAGRLHRGSAEVRRIAVLLLVVLALAAAAVPPAGANTPRSMYTAALARERAVRESASTATLRQIRSLVEAYERIVRRFPNSGYSDNALWQGAGLALEAYDRFGEEQDRRTGLRLLAALRTEYPSSSLIRQIDDRVRQFDGVSRRVAARKAAAARAPATPPPQPARGASRTGLATVRDIRRSSMPGGVRVIVELDAPVAYHEERLENPSRVFFDLEGARLAPTLAETDLAYADDLIREIRLGRHPGNTTRIVMELARTATYRVFTLADPYRLVVDFTSGSAAAAADGDAPEAGAAEPEAPSAAPPASAPAAPIAATAAAPGAMAVPSVPEANSSGKYSLARQLGLSVSRIVIDPGHGGHDPGALGPRLSEAEVVLDVALRLEKLLLARGGFEVILTRRTDLFVPLEERTVIANREGADLFLSIHANASRNPQARGVETYFLNFATNPEAEAVAARENSASARSMHNLPDILKAIALNNKLDESRDFAELVQQSMVRRLRAHNAELRNLGVKQAPFVVLIGAGMPSVLAEISFVTNRAEAQLLVTGAYRQSIAQALFEAIVEYQSSLKKQITVAQQ